LADESAKKLALRRFVGWFIATAVLFGALAWLLDGPLDLLQSLGTVIGVALVVAVAAALLGAFLDNAPPIRKE
jgi:bacteriorhodopsin